MKYLRIFTFYQRVKSNGASEDRFWTAHFEVLNSDISFIKDTGMRDVEIYTWLKNEQRI